MKKPVTITEKDIIPGLQATDRYFAELEKWHEVKEGEPLKIFGSHPDIKIEARRIDKIEKRGPYFYFLIVVSAYAKGADLNHVAWEVLVCDRLAELNSNFNLALSSRSYKILWDSVSAESYFNRLVVS